MTRKILVVDDEPEVVEILESRLKSGGYEVISASDGDGCLKKAVKESPSLILLDILMPGLNGFQVRKRLKENDKTKDIPVIMLTALAKEKDLSRGLEEGAYCFITKPFNPADLLAEIKTAIDEISK